jgi:uncharacterized protein YkwD
MRPARQLALLALAVCLLLPASAQARPSSTTVSLTSLEASVMQQINVFRVSHGLSALQLSPELTLAARSHSASMAAKGYFSHDSADGSQFWQRLRHFYPYVPGHAWAVGENLLWSSPDIDAPGALNLWLDSPPHRAILMDPKWRQLGLAAVHVESAPGVFNGGPVTVVTADFGVRR